ncbi:MAG: hypothetical protein V3S01_02840 [Dehalococcoidia bacterium]
MDLFLIVDTETGRPLHDGEGRPWVVEAWTGLDAQEIVLGLWEASGNPAQPSPFRPIKLGHPSRRSDIPTPTA